ncbi:cytochrome c oxidase subunit II [[Phormidium ambiguum] IAM M-71]|uniref:Cytochrome c oxidase subunit 2 n=1 Tax=[Phormidium ambiguum] IAM M-71 TaxID=454136 RepID=A0A1U7IB05_9CYAN|nr:cytochrome c oxidase subunit II [Phormidium ambiguum]OKH33701.1 cytochrome c oxidase subunit II [Phormidium ambiguum IAM M-71]
MKIPSNITTLIAGIVLTLVSLWYGQNHNLLPEAVSEEAPLVDNLFNMMMTIATGLFLIVQCVLIYSLFKFRKRPNDPTDGPPIHGNVPLEILWTAIPAVIILIVGVYSFEVYNSMGGLDPMAAHGTMAHHSKMSGAAIAATLPDETNSNPNPPTKIALGVGASPEEQGQTPDLNINVTGLQFAWLFNYPETGVTAGELHVPVGREVKLNISANDVIHAFWVPEFRLKQDAIPGRETQLRFTPKKPGTYPVICAELCGSYHGAMKTQVIVETPEEFDTWIQSQIAANQENLNQAVAVNPENMSTSEFLTPYAQEMGINSETLQKLHNH